MDRRTFVEALSALFLTANAPLSSKASALSYGASSTSPADQGRNARPLPLPASTSGVHTPVVSLGGMWKFNPAPASDFWKEDMDSSTWPSVDMPNEFATLGYRITPNREYPCRRKIGIPADYENQRIFIRFDGVYGYARVWMNGVYLRDHFGGFTSWDCEITDHVKAGQDADLVLGITDRSDDISQASYYAKHSVAGIIRDVRLFAVPRNYLSSLVTSATLGAQHKDGVIHLAAELSSQDFDSAQLVLTLTDDTGKGRPLTPNTIPISSHTKQTAQEIAVPAPMRWDAEHPNLYGLEVSLVVDGKTTETLRRKIGFRSVKRAGNQLFVNGQPVKLRGACRHSIHPIYGRAVPVEFDEIDAALFRAANINFVRTSHYPPTEQFLDACDRHGIYVEEETAVCWSNVDGGPSSNPEFTDRFLSQFQEMVTRDRDHASVLFWSLGNESHWGKNFEVEHRLVVEQDPSRPTIFSYPDTASLDAPAFDIFSKHYAEVSSDLRSSTYPLLNDEFAHVSCYNLDTLRRDPGIRNFWGESIRRFGDKFLTADGCLGGSIWAGIDEVFLLPDGPVGYGPWGIIDGWRREKPEYWLTKKAYSPIRIEDRPVPIPEEGSALSIPVKNAFDHTNLKDIDIRWATGSGSGSLQSVDVPPHQSSYLEIPPHTWKPGDIVQLEFHARGILIDQFRLALDPPPPSVPKPQAASASLRQSGDRLLVTGPHFAVTLSRSTGLVSEATFDGQVILKGGPYLDFGGGPLSSHWLLRSCEAAANGGSVTILTAGECKHGEGIESIPIEFEIQIDGDGLITTRYRIQGEPAGNTPLGVAYLLPANVEKLAWHRDSLWSIYPADHIGRPNGAALKLANHRRLDYRTKPEWPWSEDIGDFFLWGKENSAIQASNDFRSLKENIWYAACSLAGSNIRVRAEANADLAVRASVMPDGLVSFSLYNYWPYPDLGWGNFTGPNAAPAITSREVKLRLTNLPEE